MGINPLSVYIDANDTVYVPTNTLNRIVVWSQGNTSSSKYITANIWDPYSLFVTTSGDIYVYNSYNYRRIDRYLSNGTNTTAAMFIPSICYDIFIDINNTLYCSLSNLHQVVAKFLDDITDTKRVVAGTGCYGSNSSTLYYPYGIFIDSSFNLYVADYSNARIQLFRSGQLNGTTVAGATASNSFTLNGPIDVILDADEYLFIVDKSYGYSRIVGSGPNGFRCIIACSNIMGSSSDELYDPWSMAFDSQGNIYVADSGNNRIQKFALTNNTCGTYHYISHSNFRYYFN